MSAGLQQPTCCSCQLQAAGALLRLADRLQEGGVLVGGQRRGKLTHVTRHQVGLLVPDQEGDVRFQHVHTHFLLQNKEITSLLLPFTSY